jgi:perosamine synthetase
MSSHLFLPLAATSSNYPRPCCSMTTSTLHLSWLVRKPLNTPSAFLSQPGFYIYGRYALVEALRRAGVGPASTVLLPSMHCRTVVDSALFLRADVRFYPVTLDLKPDFSLMRSLVAGGRVRAMLLTHYFGFPNAHKETRAFCSEVGIALVEDCAHAFYGNDEGATLGTVGDYAIASAWKFLPVRGGAMLRDNVKPTEISHLVGQPWVTEVKAVAAQIERHVHSKLPLPAINVEHIVTRTFELGNLPLDFSAQSADPDNFRSDLVNSAGLRVSHWLTSHYPHQFAIDQRRKRYEQWLEGVAAVTGIHPLFPTLPAGVVPYAFPLLADTSGLAFHALRLAGIPIWRWEDMAVDAVETCPVARDFRLRLLQLPCHQDLSDAEMDWMIDVVRRVLPKVLQ